MKRAPPRDAVLALGLTAQDHLLAALRRSGVESAQAWHEGEQARDARMEQAMRDLVTEGLVPGNRPGVAAKRPRAPGPAAAALKRV
jgi:hypothetical protein